MAPLIPVNYSDPRLQPGALVTDGTRLLEVQKAGGVQGATIVLDCKTDVRSQVRAWDVIQRWRLVREAPSAPDLIPEEA